MTLIERVRELRGALDTTAVEDGRWTERAQATIDEVIVVLETLSAEGDTE